MFLFHFISQRLCNSLTLDEESKLFLQPLHAVVSVVEPTRCACPFPLFVRTLMSCPSCVPMKNTIQAFCLTASTAVMWSCLKMTASGLRVFSSWTQTCRQSDYSPAFFLIPCNDLSDITDYSSGRWPQSENQRRGEADFVSCLGRGTIWLRCYCAVGDVLHLAEHHSPNCGDNILHYSELTFFFS